MNYVTSNDGTAIAYDRLGDGPPVILIGFPFRSLTTQLAALLAPHFTVFNYDRRGRGDSGDTQPYALEREFEDLGALIAEAGGTACVFGSSGTGIFALEAAAHGASITKLAVWETPYIVDNSRPPLPTDYVEQLTQLLSQGRRGKMVELFYTAAVGLPSEFVAQMRHTPFWQAQEAQAHTLIYDARMTRNLALPAERLASIRVPTLVVDGGQAAWPWIRHATQLVVETVPNAQHHVLEGQTHNVDSEALAPVLIEFFAS